MPSPDSSRSRGAVLRGIGFGLAVALGAVAVWLIVTSTTQKRLELGVLSGLWGLLLGAFSLFGTRRGVGEDLNAGGAAHGEAVSRAGAGLEVRSRATQMERAEDVAARRAHEARIEEMLREEIRGAVNREVGTLRAEIAQLRTDLLEKVGGQLRLEHIETTRVIGSDLEALQGEIRALKSVTREEPRGSSSLHDLGRVHRAPDRPRTATTAEPAAHEVRTGRVIEVESSVVKTAVVDAAQVEPGQRTFVPRPAEASVRPDRSDQQRRDQRPDQQRPIAPRRPNSDATGPARPGDLTAPIEAVRADAPTPLQTRRDVPPTPPKTTVRQPSSPPAGYQPAQQPINRKPPPTPAPSTTTPPVLPQVPAVAHTPSGPQAQPEPEVSPAAQTPSAPPTTSFAPAVDETSSPEPTAPTSERAAVPPRRDSPDVFAGLPRLSRFVDDSPVVSTPPPADQPAQEPAEDERSYNGRRRRSDEILSTRGTDGSHQRPEPATEERVTGGRRRRPDDRQDDLLAQLLAREKN